MPLESPVPLTCEVRPRPLSVKREDVTRWLVVALAGIESGWMVFDGARALVVGDYVTPQTGEYAGQLGPWAALISAIGIDPRSTAMKLAFVGYGGAWLLVAGAFARRAPWARAA